MTNQISIDVETVDKTGLDKMVASYQRAGKEMGDGLGKGVDAAERKMEKLKPAAAKVEKSFSDMAKAAASDLDRIEREAHESADGMSDSMAAAVRSMRADLERVEQQAGQTGGRLDSELGAALKNIRADARKTRDELEDALKPPEGGGGWGESLAESFGSGFDISGLIEGGLGKVGASGGLVTAGAAAGALYATAVYDAFSKYWANDKIGGLIAAQQGASTSSALRLGRLAGEAYYSGITDSVEESGAALSGILTQGLADTDAAESEIQKLTNMAATAAKVVGEDANRIARAAKQLLVTGLAGNATEAIDLIVSASQNGANAAGDMIDTIEEYNVQFQMLGLTGEEALGLINQSLAAGARNSDIAADAMKEFVIIAQDGSESAARGFKALGLDAGKMGDDIAAGGDRARNAFDLTLDRLRQLPPSAEKSQIAFDLFGTKSEDLARALEGMDLDTVAGEMGNVEGATQRAQDTIAATEPPTEKVARGFDKMTQSSLAAAFAVLGINKELEQSSGKWEKGSGGSAKFGGALDEAGSAADGAARSTNEYTESIDELISKQQEAVDGIVDYNDAQIDAQKAIADANEAIKEFAGAGLNAAKDGFDLTSEAGQELSSSLLDVADTTWDTVAAMQQQGKTQQEIQGYVDGSKQRFLELADRMGLSSAAAKALADRMFDIPTERKTTAIFDDAKALAKARFYDLRTSIATRSRRTNVDANTTNAMARLEWLRVAADVATRTRVLDIIVNQSVFGALPRLGRESGGIASGIGSAQTGGARHGSTMINEAGPEIVGLPSGAKVMTAGATRAALESGMVQLGGGDGGSAPTKVVELRSDGSALSNWVLKTVREAVRDEGGDVQLVLGPRR